MSIDEKIRGPIIRSCTVAEAGEPLRRFEEDYAKEFKRAIGEYRRSNRPQEPKNHYYK